MILYRAGQPGETAAGYSNFFASTRLHAETYREFHASKVWTDRDRSVLYSANVETQDAEVADITSRRAQLFKSPEGPTSVLATIDTWRDRGYRWLVFPDWMGMAWIYLGAQPIALTPVSE